MIVAKRKPFAEIKNMLKDYKKVLNVGCGTCVAWCPSGAITLCHFSPDAVSAELEGLLKQA